MRSFHPGIFAVTLAGALLLVQPSARGQADAPTFAKDQIREFLLKAKIVSSKQSDKGITNPWRLTLNNGTTTHDASFQAIDEHRMSKQFDNGKSEMNFVDSYHYNIAAYNIAEMLGLDSMMPMSVERRWTGKLGSITWWVDNIVMDEGARLKSGKSSPDAEDWNRQMYRMRVFSQLVYDTDRNLTNVLITNDWKVWMIDFSRAFRLWPDLASTKDLARGDRELLTKLRNLTAENVEAAIEPHLGKSEIRAVIARRDKILAHYDQLIAQNGEATVLY